MQCSTARWMMGKSLELSPAQIRALEAHLNACPVCLHWDANGNKEEVTLRSYIGRVDTLPSIRPEVLRQIEARRRQRTRIWPPFWLALPLAVLAALVSLLSPGTLGDGRILMAGAAWRHVWPEIGYPLAVDPARPNHLLAGSWGQIYQSWNAGDTWSRLGSLPPRMIVRSIAIDGTVRGRYLVATEHSVLLSDDRGIKWRTVARSLPGAKNMFVLQDPSVPGTFYLGPSTLWKSSDRGLRWAPSGPGRVFAPDGIQALSFGPRSLFTAIWHNGVMQSPDGGATWRRVGTGLATNVMDVEWAPRAGLWAATDRGVYRFGSARSVWTPVHLPTRLFATSVLPSRKFILAAGNGGVYRSADDGRTWSLAMEGLPLDPYVNSLIPDPERSNRVYASLNTDGIFRSDNGGRTWKAVNSGLPLTGSVNRPTPVLFLRRGALWITDSRGTDPGVLTVDRDVRLAALAPDGTAIAYLAASPRKDWAVGVLSAGGSTVRTLASGNGPPPNVLTWSPDSSRLAIGFSDRAEVSNLASKLLTSYRDSESRLLGFLSSGRGLLHVGRAGTIWQTTMSGRKVSRLGSVPRGITPAYSVSAAQLAWVAGDKLYVSTIGGSVAVAAPSVGTCRASDWSASGTRLILACAHTNIVVDVATRVRRRLPAGVAQWVSGSDSDIALFDHKQLTVLRTTHLVRGNVAGADPALPSEPTS